jgi:ferritin-like metal-binding protein YciE
MAQLNELELQNLRELIGAHKTGSAKLRTYAQQCNDPQVKQLFEQAARSADSTIQKLTTFLR